jgi:hypothetical protein
MQSVCRYDEVKADGLVRFHPHVALVLLLCFGLLATFSRLPVCLPLAIAPTLSAPCNHLVRLEVRRVIISWEPLVLTKSKPSALVPRVRVCERLLFSPDCSATAITSFTRRDSHTFKMPPDGLYQMPRHHLNGQGPSAKRLSFSSMDFVDNEPEQASAAISGDATETAEEKTRRKQEKRERKEKKKKRKESPEAQPATEPENAADTRPAAADPAPVAAVKNGRYGPRGPYKKKEKNPDGTPKSAKKRKRESGAYENGGDGMSLLDPSFVEGVKKSMGEIGADLVQQPKGTEPPPQKKRGPGRPPGKKTGPDDEATKKKEGQSATNGVSSSEGKAKKHKTERARDNANLENTFRMIRTPVPVPSIASALGLGTQKKPIPVHLQSHHLVAGAMSEPQPKKSKTVHDDSHVLVAETPPSQMPSTPATTRQPAIPFSLNVTQPRSSAEVRLKKSKGPTVDISSPEVDRLAPVSAPAKLARAEKPVVGSQGSPNALNSSQLSFTASNLMNYKQPLNDNPKPRPRGRAASVATSTTSSASSSTHRSIKDMFLRVGKPYTDPISSSQEAAQKKKKAKPIETHTEADLSTFTVTYNASQQTINFTDETEYLKEYHDWQSSSSAAGPLPCLKQATGCSTKNETILRLQKEDPSNVLKLLLTTVTEAEVQAAEDAIAACMQADTFLAHSITARVPVPLGRIEGVWKLYCPHYTSTHVDGYAFGQRTLIISSTAGFRTPSSSSYTARLRIPPRSMAYIMLSFEVPPHASFRTTVLQTVDEKYKLEVMFLGNGYLKLRVDLQLLLKGKSAKGKGREAEGVWEFLGVNEKAVAWREEVDELEVEGRKLCAKYDGGVRK